MTGACLWVSGSPPPASSVSSEPPSPSPSASVDVASEEELESELPPHPATATAAIVVCGDLETAFDRQLSFLLQDCSAAIENLLLAAHALGLGACWVGVHPIEDAVKQLKQMLSLPTSVVPVAAIALGHPGEQPGPRTRFNPDHVHFEKW